MQTPPGIYSKYTAETRDIEIYARLVHFDERTTPIKAYVFNAKHYTIEGDHVTPLKEQRQGDPESNHVAEFIGPTTTDTVKDTNAIFYHLDEFNDLCKKDRIPADEYQQAIENDDLPELPSFTRHYILAELHELCHWAADTQQQPTTREHSPVWNTVLMNEIVYSTDIDSTEPNYTYDFDTPESLPVTVPDKDTPPSEHQSEEQTHISDM